MGLLFIPYSTKLAKINWFSSYVWILASSAPIVLHVSLALIQLSGGNIAWESKFTHKQ